MPEDEDAQVKIASEFADLQIKVISAVFDKATAYTNLIVIGGYAGFFGLWQLSKDHLSKAQILWSALFISLSLIVFIFFEVVKMTLQSRFILNQAKVLRSSTVRQNLDILKMELNKLDVSQSEESLRFAWIWGICLSFSVVTALGGAGILMYAFIVGLWAN